MEQIFRMLGIILWMWCPIIHITNVYGNNLKQLSNTDGLSNNAVLSLYQDYDRLLWLGTCDGLNLYDGLNIRPFTLSEGKNLSGNIIENILETDRGTLWIQTNYGLDKINKYTRSITSYTQFQGGYLLKKSPKNDIFILSERNNCTIFCMIRRSLGNCPFRKLTKTTFSMYISMNVIYGCLHPKES